MVLEGGSRKEERVPEVNKEGLLCNEFVFICFLRNLEQTYHLPDQLTHYVSALRQKLTISEGGELKKKKRGEEMAVAEQVVSSMAVARGSPQHEGGRLRFGI
jgi:hypothetical protein